MFGALAASGCLPFGREVCEAVVKTQGKAAERSLRGFALAFDAVQRERGQLPLAKNGPSHQAAVGAIQDISGFAATAEPGHGAVDPAVMPLPAAVRAIAHLGYQRLVEYQGRSYAELYLGRLTAVIEQEQGADLTGVHGYAVAQEVARYLALWMAFDDIVRVADLKARRQRGERLRREVKVAPGELLRVYDFFKPGLPEVAALLPASFARRLADYDRRRIARGQEAAVISAQDQQPRRGRAQPAAHHGESALAASARQPLRARAAADGALARGHPAGTG